MFGVDEYRDFVRLKTYLDAQKEMLIAKDDLTRMLAEMLEKQDKHILFFDIELGRPFSCDKSPVYICCYNGLYDPCHDECLFCGQPEERN